VELRGIKGRRPKDLSSAHIDQLHEQIEAQRNNTMSSDIIYRQLGKNGPKGEYTFLTFGELATDGCTLPVTALGFGAMGLSAVYGNRVGDKGSHDVIKAAVDEGCTFIDTSNVSTSLL
jgi:hypothetical protein